MQIKAIVAARPRVGTLLSPETAVLRGQLASLGFTPCDGAEAGIDWLATDGSAQAPETGVPVLRVEGKISIYNLRHAIVALFDGRKD